MKSRYLPLYALLGLVLVGAGAITIVELKCGAFNFQATHWLSLIAIVAAVTGWITTSLITLYNARRQHTINVLLQSRLSQAYQQRLRDVVEKYPTLDKIQKVEIGDWHDKEKMSA